jgi:hypothetical protein
VVPTRVSMLGQCRARAARKERGVKRKGRGCGVKAPRETKGWPPEPQTAESAQRGPPDQCRGDGLVCGREAEGISIQKKRGEVTVSYIQYSIYIKLLSVQGSAANSAACVLAADAVPWRRALRLDLSYLFFHLIIQKTIQYISFLSSASVGAALGTFLR